MDKIPHLYRQDKVGYCSPILFANIFNDSTFLDYLNNDNFFSSGENEWNIMVNDVNNNLKRLEILYLNQNYGNGQLPLDLIEKVVKKKIEVENSFQIPIVYYFLTVQITTVDIWHSTAILNINNNLWYSDPYNEYMFKFNDINEIKNQFIKCHSIETLIIKNTKAIACLAGEYIFGSKVQSSLLN